MPESKKPAPSQTAMKSDSKSTAGDAKAAAATAATAATTAATGPGASTKPDKPTPPPSRPGKENTPQPNSQTSIAARLVPALLGGLIALAGAGLLQYVGLIGSPGKDVVSVESFKQQQQGFTERMTSLEARLDSVSKAADSAIIGSQIDERLQEWTDDAATSNTDMDAIANQVNETTVRVEKLIAGQQSNGDSLALLESAISAGSGGDKIAAGVINDRLTANSERVDQMGTTLNRLSEAFDQLANDTKATVATARSAAEEAGSTDQSTAALNDTKQLLATLTKRLISIEKSQKDLSTVAGEIDTLRSQLATAGNALNDNKSAIDSIQERLANANSADNFAARAVAAAALKSDIDQGIKFQDSLATLRRLAPDDKLLGELEIYGQKNIPTASQLLREFNGLTSPILDTLETKGDGSLSSRLVAGVKKFVKVRPTAPVKGDSPKALVSQILDALEKGELQRASDRWKRLPENAQAVSAQWHEKLLARITVNDLISKTVQSYLNATTLQ